MILLQILIRLYRFTEFSMINISIYGGSFYCLFEKYEKLLILRDRDKKVSVGSHYMVAL